MINGGDWTTAIIFDAKHGAFEDYPIHFPCPTTPPTPGPESSPGGSGGANAPSAGHHRRGRRSCVILLVLLAGYFILKNVAAPLPMKASIIQQTSCGRRNRPAKALRRRRCALGPVSPHTRPYTGRPSCNLVFSTAPGWRGLGVRLRSRILTPQLRQADWSQFPVGLSGSPRPWSTRAVTISYQPTLDISAT